MRRSSFDRPHSPWLSKALVLAGLAATLTLGYKGVRWLTPLVANATTQSKTFIPDHQRSEIPPAPVAVPGRTGLLYIYGPNQENPSEAAPTANDIQIMFKDFRQTFADYPVETLGDGDMPITMGMILEKLDSLATKDIDQIVLIQKMHGHTIFNEVQGVDGESFLRADNELYKNRQDPKHNSGSSEKLYQGIAQHWQKNPDLETKGLFVIHVSCEGESAVPAFHHLPAGSFAFFYAMHTTVSYSIAQSDAFAAAFKQLSARKPNLAHPVQLDLTPNMICASAALAANALIGDKEHFNNFGMVYVTGDEPDTVTRDGIRYFMGPQAGVTTSDSSDLLLMGAKFNSADIVLQVQNAGVPLNRMQIDKVCRLSKELRETNYAFLDRTQLQNMRIVGVLMAANNTDSITSSTQYAVDRGVLAPVIE